jgi:hypothetical protein
MASQTIRIEQLPGVLERLVEVVVPQLSVELKNAVTRELFLEIVTLSPVGHPGSDDHPGKFRASNVASLGEPRRLVLPDMAAYPVPGAADIDAVLQGSTRENVEVPAWIANAAADEARPDDPYAWILELGRHTDSLGRAAGSNQALEGVYVVAVANVGDRHATLETNAIRAVERLLF